MRAEAHASAEARQVDLARTFAEFAHGLTYEQIPADVIEITKKLILDQLGVLILGSSAAGIDTLVEAAADWGGKPEATIPVFGLRVPADRAALINGTMARALDYDSLHEKGIVHVTAGCLPQCLVIAERNGPVDGRGFIVAMVAGTELMIRLGICTESVFLHTGRVTTLHQATFGGALAAGKLLRLDADRLVAALGIAFAHVSGTLQMAREGSVLVRVQQGFADQAAVLSALLAEKGLGSIEQVFQGEFGYFRAYHDNKYSPIVMTRGLGTQYETRDVSVKYYPCCFLAHFAIEAMRQLVQEHKFSADDVQAITVGVNKGVHTTVGSPIEAKRVVTNTQEALFSAPYTVATALMHGAVKLEHMLEPSALSDPAIREIAAKIRVEIDPEIERQYSRGMGPAIVDVTLKNGKKLSQRADLCKGHPQRPMSMDDCEEKFWSCVPYAAKPLERAKFERLVAKVRRLEELDDVAELMTLLVP